jgi:hypothetical protein
MGEFQFVHFAKKVCFRPPKTEHGLDSNSAGLGNVNYPDPKGSGLVIPNFVSGLTDGRRFTPTDTEFEDKPNGRQ